MMAKVVYKLWDVGGQKKLVAASDFEELCEKAKKKFGFHDAFFYMADGTEVDDEDGLRGIKAEGVLYVTAQQGFSIKDFPEASTGEESDTTILLNSSSASLSSEEGAYSDLSTSTTTTEEQLHIPRELLPFAFRKCIENKEVPSPRDKRTVARAIADMIVERKRSAGRKVFIQLAEQVVGLEPESFKTELGNGVTAFAGLIENAYYNHSFVRETAKKGLRSKLQSKKKRKASSDEYGCVSWQPDSYPDGEDEESQEVKQLWLQDHVDSANQNVSQVKDYMNVTYASQQLCINKEPPTPLNEIRKQWPYLFFAPYFEEHFYTLTGSSSEVYYENLESKSKMLMKFFSLPSESKCYKKWFDLMDIAKLDRLEVPIEAVTMCMLCSYFKDDDTLFLRAVQESAHLGDHQLVQTEIANPCVLYTGRNPFSSDRLAVVIDQKSVLFPNSLMNGMKLAFMAYYVLNIKYPEGLSNTLEFFQRLLFRVKPARGNKRRNGQNPKLGKLCESLVRMEKASWR